MTLSTTFPPKPRACAHCGGQFVPARMGQKVCGPVCAHKAVLAKKVEERAQIRTRKEAVKTIPKLIAEAQEAFNAWVRHRDEGKGCFVCGALLRMGGIGGGFDAGHIRSRGAAGHLRFTEDNCHGECKSCNSSTGAKPHQIKAGAIARIGLERFEALENDNTPRKWTAEGLRAIRDDYRARVRAMKKERP
jgi:hypothetical protein